MSDHPEEEEGFSGVCRFCGTDCGEAAHAFDEAAKLRKENERLRKALEHYIDMTTLAIPDWWDWQGNCGRGPDTDELEKRDVGDVARAALGINDVVNERL